jgi:hypothetical protein
MFDNGDHETPGMGCYLKGVRKKLECKRVVGAAVGRSSRSDPMIMAELLGNPLGFHPTLMPRKFITEQSLSSTFL